MAEAMEEIRQARPRRFRPYPEYRDSRVEWLGEVPAGWHEHKMGYLVSSISGGTPSKDNPEFWRGDIPWVSPKDMKVRTIRDAADHVSELALAQTGLKLIEPPAVLIVVRGMILAHTFPVAVTAVPATINQDMKALKLRQDVSPDFLTYLIEGAGRYFLSLIEEAGHGTKRLRSDLWRSTKLFLPAPDEQRAIASFLDRETAKIDGLVTKKERLIELLQENRTALITRTVTQGLDPNVPMKDSGVDWLGKIPAHWEVRRVRHLVRRIEQGWSPDCENREADLEEWGVLKAGCVNRGSFVESEHKALPSDLDSVPELEIAEGDVLMSRASGSRELVGSVAVVPKVRPRLLLCDKVFRLHVDSGSDRQFLAYAMNSRVARSQIEVVLSGGSGLANNIPQEAVKDLVLAQPAFEEQRSITAFLDSETAKLDTLVAKVRDAIDRLKEFRTALISAAVTGKIDVREETA